MMQPIPEAIQAERLTATFRRTGVLGNSHVSHVTVESSRDTILSRIIRVRLNYGGAAGDAPRFLICKTSHPDRVGDALHAGRQEVAFYNQIAPMMAANIVPRCFQAHHDAETNVWHLLLEDLTETHAVPTQWPFRHHGSNAAQSFERTRVSMRPGGIARVLVSPSGRGSTPRPWTGRCSLSRTVSGALPILRVTCYLASVAGFTNSY